MVIRRINRVFRKLLRRFRTQRMRSARIIKLDPIRTTTTHSRSLLLIRRIGNRLLIINSIRLLRVRLKRSVRHHAQLSRQSTISLIRHLVRGITLLMSAATKTSMIISKLVTTRHHLSSQLDQRIKTRTRIQRRISTRGGITRTTLITQGRRPTGAVTHSRIQLKRATGNSTKRVKDRQNGQSILMTIRTRTIMSLVDGSRRLVPTYGLSSTLRRLTQMSQTHKIIKIGSGRNFNHTHSLKLRVLRIKVPVHLLVTRVIREVATNGNYTHHPRQVIKTKSRGLITVIRRHIRQGLGRLKRTITHMSVLRLGIKRTLSLQVLRSHLTHKRRTAQIKVTFTIKRLLTRILSSLVKHTRARKHQITSVRFRSTLTLILRANNLISSKATRIVRSIVRLNKFEGDARNNTPYGLD